MNKEILIAWAAGIFEGEGTFCFNKGFPKSISITSTDIDVLEKIKTNFKGKIYKTNKSSAKPHWKIAYIWVISGEAADEFYMSIRPYLLSRRLERGDEWTKARKELFLKRLEDNQIISNRNKEIISLRELGYTQQQIADKINLERSTVAKILIRCLSLKRNKASTCEVEDYGIIPH